MTIARIAVIVLLLGGAGCNLLPGGGSLAVAGRDFLSTSVTEGGIESPLVAGTQIRISFTAEGNMLSASAGCNQFGALYRIDGGVLAITDGIVTEMGCEPALAAQDEWLFQLLGAQPLLTLDGDELMVEEGETVITLLDREVAEPDLPLIGPVWTVTSVVTGDAVQSAPEGVLATMVFTDEGQVTVNTGCNTGSGSVEIRTNTISFGDIALTRMACEGAAAEMERTMLQVLGADVVRYAVDASQLELSIGGSGLQLSGSALE